MKREQLAASGTIEQGLLEHSQGAFVLAGEMVGASEQQRRVAPPRVLVEHFRQRRDRRVKILTSGGSETGDQLAHFLSPEPDRGR